MANQARVVVLKETKREKDTEGWILYFQYCRYEYEDGSEELGYRFIWRRPDNTLQAARGQARIPSLDIALELVSNSIKEGWGHHLNN